VYQNKKITKIKKKIYKYNYRNKLKIGYCKIKWYFGTHMENDSGENQNLLGSTPRKIAGELK